MKRWNWALALAIALGSSFSAARAADHIECVQDGYTEREVARLARFDREFRLTDLDGDPLPQDIFVAVTRRAGECADAHAWSPDAIEDATFYRLGFILKDVLVSHSPLTPTQMQRLEQVITSADQERLGQIVGEVLDEASEGRQATPSDADNMYMGRLIIRAGIPATESNGEFVGAFIAAQIMSERSQRRFANR